MTQEVKVVINGLGRIGRPVTKRLIQLGIYPVAFNDLSSPKALADLLAFDSVHGHFPLPVKAGEKSIIIGDREIPLLAERDPAKLGWGRFGEAIIAVEATGVFRSRVDLDKHLSAGAHRVALTVPADDSNDVDATVVLGVNDKVLTPATKRVSNASCTTNCTAPMIEPLHRAFRAINGMLETTHAATNDQRVNDLLHSDPRRARGVFDQIIPTSTGAAKAIGLIIPELDGLLDGLSDRVPTADGSTTNLVLNFEREVTVESILATYREAAATPQYKGILAVSDEPLTSKRIIGRPESCIIDAGMIRVAKRAPKTALIKGWYDNEWGYSCRVADLVIKLAQLG